MNAATTAVYQHMLTTSEGRAFYSKSCQEYGRMEGAPALSLYGQPDWVANAQQGTRLACLVAFGIEKNLWPAELSDKKLLLEVDFAAIIRQMWQAQVAGQRPAIVAQDGWQKLHNALHPELPYPTEPGEEEMTVPESWN